MFKDMADGKIAYNRRYYTIPQVGGSKSNSDITLISPTEQQVQIAKSNLKRKL